MWASAGQNPAAGLGHEDIVFDPHAESAGDIYAGLYGDNLAGIELFCLAIGLEEGQFVNFQTEAVSRAMAVNGQAGVPNYVSRSGIHQAESDARFYRLYCGGLGTLNNLEDPA